MASKLILITVFIFDVIAFGLAIAAEQRRSTVSLCLVSKNSLPCSQVANSVAMAIVQVVQ